MPRGSAEAGDASITRAVNTALGNDFRKAEETSVPVTLILLPSDVRVADRGGHPG
jgi:hypothetical protein